MADSANGIAHEVGEERHLPTGTHLAPSLHHFHTLTVPLGFKHSDYDSLLTHLSNPRKYKITKTSKLEGAAVRKRTKLIPIAVRWSF